MNSPAGMEAAQASLRLRRVLRPLCLLVLLLLSGCHRTHDPLNNLPAPPPVAASSHPSEHRNTVPARSPLSPAQPQRTPDRTYNDQLDGKPIATEIGLASWYGPPYHNRQAADGSIFDQNAMTAAHRTLPMGSTVRVTNLETNEAVVVKITDRGPFVPNRILDLSLAAAKQTGIYRAGVARVKVEIYAHPTADPEGRWCVQIGAFLDPADAIQLKNDLMRRYATARVIEFAGPTGHWVRINTATADHTTAEQIANSIHIPDADPYLVRLN